MKVKQSLDFSEHAFLMCEGIVHLCYCLGLIVLNIKKKKREKKTTQIESNFLPLFFFRFFLKFNLTFFFSFFSWQRHST